LLLALSTVVPFAPNPVHANQAATEPEAYLLQLINAARADEGKVALRWDGRLADIAQWRSDYQVVNGFGHLSSWGPIINRMNAMGIVHYGYGEVLVLGTPRTPLESAEEAVATWHASQAHWAWLSSPDFNYIALGMARDANGWYYWTGLLLKGPDRTPPTVTITGSRMGDAVNGHRPLTLSWSGTDVPLSVLTSGVRDYRVQRRIGSGRWVAVTDWISATSRQFDLTVGKKYRFRVRARDNAGNRSVWTQVAAFTP
jgi:hypothetical protein